MNVNFINQTNDFRSWFDAKHHCDICHDRIGELYKKLGDQFIESAPSLQRCAEWSRNNPLTNTMTKAHPIEEDMLARCHDYLSTPDFRAWFHKKRPSWSACNERIDELYRKFGDKFVELDPSLKECQAWSRKHPFSSQMRIMMMTKTDCEEWALLDRCRKYLSTPENIISAPVASNNFAASPSSDDEKTVNRPDASPKADLLPPKTIEELPAERVEELRRNHQIGWLGGHEAHKFDINELKAWFEAKGTCPCCQEKSSYICQDYGRKFAVMDPRFCKQPFPVPYQRKAHILPFKTCK